MQVDSNNQGQDRAHTVEGWVKTYSAGMFGYAATRMGNSADAEDVVQECFIKAYRSFDRFAPGSDAKSWLYQILINTIKDHYRRTTSRGQTVPIDDANQIEIEMSALMPSPEALAEQKETMTMLGQALTRLPEQLSAPLMLREIADQSYKEIAAVLEIPIGTVMSRLSRARKLLANIVGPQLGLAPLQANTEKANLPSQKRGQD